MDSTARKPVFESLEHVSAGWINKYVLTYRMPDGRTHVYESASRKKRDDYERELRAMDELAIKREGAAGSASDKASRIRLFNSSNESVSRVEGIGLGCISPSLRDIFASLFIGFIHVGDSIT